jgi:hypothetical protein
MKITVTRSFSKKVQLKQFEPVDSFCGATIEFDSGDDVGISVTDKAKMEAVSTLLDTLCRAEVETTLAKIRGPKEQGKSPTERREDAKASAEHDAGSTAPSHNWKPV